MLLVFLLLIDIRLAAALYALPAIGCFHGAQSIGVLPHLWGYRRYNVNDKSHNNWLASILALGEGWHNNHHHFPSSAKQGFYWWEIDLTYYGLNILSALGLIWDLRKVPSEVLSNKRVSQ